MKTQFYLNQRRKKLAEIFPHPVILWSGHLLSRNFPANHYPFRASSHFLYFTNLCLPNAAIYLHQGKSILFWDSPAPDSIMWHGETLSKQDIAQKISVAQVLPLSELSYYSLGAATISVSNLETYQQQCAILNRLIPPPNQLTGIDKELAEAIVRLRLQHDELAVEEIKQAVQVTVKAHLQGIKSVTRCRTEAQVRGIIEGQIMASQMSCAYNSIVTVKGNVLHNEQYSHHFDSGDLLLVDVGAETQNGWAADITRTYPVTGKFSSTQKDIYEVVLAAHDDCIEQIREGVEYKEIHHCACRTLIDGLLNLGILQGKPDQLFEQNIHSLFFPHGVGHLLGLDVHDMEDIGDLAGYGHKSRSSLFGLKYLRLDRPLQSGMVVTIEPGFYQIPALLRNPKLISQCQAFVNWDRLALFKDVLGIRIEDDILVTKTGCEVLSQQLPSTIKDLEALIL